MTGIQRGWLLVNPEFPTKSLTRAEGQGSHSADLGPVFTFSHWGPQTQADKNPQRNQVQFPKSPPHSFTQFRTFRNSEETILID